MKILLDTDIGSNIDDALCLAYLLKHPQCELVGITTVSGHATHRATIAQRICQAFGHDSIPIYSGSSQPLYGEQKQTHLMNTPITNASQNDKKPLLDTLNFMRDIIRQNPHEITLLSIGPLTNSALLFRLDRELPALLKQMIIMGGVYTDEHKKHEPLERNAANDPLATAIVFDTDMPNRIAIGLEITRQCAISGSECQQRIPYPIIYELAGDYFEKEQVFFNDPLAAAIITEPSLCTYQHGDIDVDLQTGETTFTPAHHSNTKIATSVDTQQFFKHYFTILNRKDTL